jgi:hypothetical protein
MRWSSILRWTWEISECFWRRCLVLIYLRWENKTISLQVREQSFMDYGACMGDDNQGGLATKGSLRDAPQKRLATDPA